VKREFIHGVNRAGQRFVTLLEPDKAFDLDDMAGLCDAAQEAAFA
jgi:purine-binding chemotaxis protein CheW